jgi:two-component system, OmpR family, response regulator CpxR
MAEPTRSLLLVDDDIELCALMTEILGAQGLRLVTAHDGAGGLALAREQAFDMVILDVMLPGMDGFEVLRRLRQLSEIPVIMLTARTATTDRIAGLELGADDYLPKPFEPRELYARIRGVLRRANRQSVSQGEMIEVGPVRIDPTRRQVWNGSREVGVTTAEFDILDVLMRQAGQIVTRAELIAKLYGREPSGFDRSIEVHICHLRQKLVSATPLIRTIRGTGYQFCAAAGREAQT